MLKLACFSTKPHLLESVSEYSWYGVAIRTLHKQINSDSIVKGRQSGHVIGGVAAIPYRAICTMCMQSVLDLRYDLSLSICDRFATEDAIHADARVSSYA